MAVSGKIFLGFLGKDGALLAFEWIHFDNLPLYFLNFFRIIPIVFRKFELSMD